MLRVAQAKADAAGGIEWLVSVDSAVVRAHQQAAGARKRGPDARLGRSLGGLTSKVHLACDALGRPLAFTLTGGNTNDCTQFTTVMEASRVPRIGPGRPRVRPAHVLGDKGYSSKDIRTWLRQRGIKAAIPERIDQINGHIRRGESRCRLDRVDYWRRNIVEMSKPQCSHTCGSLSLLWAPVSFWIIAIRWWYSQGWRAPWPRGSWCSRRKRPTSAGSAWMTQERRRSDNRGR